MRRCARPRGGASPRACSLHELHDVRRHSDELVLLVLDLDLGDRAFALALDSRDLVVDCDGVAKIDLLQEADSVIAHRHHGPAEILEDACGRGPGLPVRRAAAEACARWSRRPAAGAAPCKPWSEAS